MFGGLDPKKLGAVMKQLGMKQEEIPAERVIIEGKKKIIIENPSVVKIVMQGKESFQISGDIKEEGKEEGSEEEETGEDEKYKKDIEMIAKKTHKSKEDAALALEKNDGDIAATILELSE